MKVEQVRPQQKPGKQFSKRRRQIKRNTDFSTVPAFPPYNTILEKTVFKTEMKKSPPLTSLQELTTSSSLATGVRGQPQTRRHFAQMRSWNKMLQCSIATYQGGTIVTL